MTFIADLEITQMSFNKKFNYGNYALPYNGTERSQKSHGEEEQFWTWESARAG